MKKIGRNDLCYCGSKIKYKYCCLEKNKIDSQIDVKSGITISSIIDIIEFGLSKLDILSEDCRKVKVKGIQILNKNTIECQIYPYYSDSNDIKLEIATVMGFLHGLFEGNSFADTIEPKYFAIRAYDEGEEEIIYAISSIETAGFIASGNTIAWLKSTIFQENTNSYRLTIAKKQISEIENALRIVVSDILSIKHGVEWWDKSVGEKLSKSVKSDYENQYGENINDGAVLIKYSYLRQLKKIICTNWKDFKHLFESKIGFEDSLDKLNLIRREEAHNREITKEHIEDLKEIYFFILPVISNIYPQIIPELLIENWKTKIREIMSNGYKPLYGDTNLMEEPNQQTKLIKSTTSILHLIDYLTKTEGQLTSLVVPVQKSKIHISLVEILSNYRLLQEKLIEFAQKGLIEELEGTAVEIDNYKQRMDSFIHKFLLEEG